MEKWKIDPRILESIEDTKTRLLASSNGVEFMVFLGDLQTNNLLIRNSQGIIINKDGCYYFDDPDELIFPKATSESKKELRKAIEANMVPANTKVD